MMHVWGRRAALLSLVSALGAGCGGGASVFQTTAAKLAGYAYVPIDPMPVEPKPGPHCDTEDPRWTPLLDALPDNTVRTSVTEFDAKGEVTYGVGAVKVAGNRYRITTDYINSDTVSVDLWFKKELRLWDEKSQRRAAWDVVTMTEAKTGDLVQYCRDCPARYSVRHPDEVGPDAEKQGWRKYSVPVYVGIGLRVTSNVSVSTSEVSVNGLGDLGAQAQAGSLQGDLVVQTLGVNGEAVTGAIPIQSELNRTTVMNAVVAIGAIKALLRDVDTIKSQRLVGMYLPFPGDEALVNEVISALSRRVVSWKRPCGDPRVLADAIPPELLNLNKATAAELELLPGIGATLAAAIVNEREARGDYESMDQLEDRVRGVGPGTILGLSGLVRLHD